MELNDYDVTVEFEDKTIFQQHYAPSLPFCINKLLTDAVFYKDINFIENIEIELKNTLY